LIIIGRCPSREQQPVGGGGLALQLRLLVLPLLIEAGHEPAPTKMWLGRQRRPLSSAYQPRITLPDDRTHRCVTATINVRAKKLIVVTFDAVREEFWPPIPEHGRQRGDVRSGLTDHQIVRWFGAVPLTFLGTASGTRTGRRSPITWRRSSSRQCWRVLRSVGIGCRATSGLPDSLAWRRDQATLREPEALC